MGPARVLIRQLFDNLELTGDDDEKPWLCDQERDRQTQDNADSLAQ